MQDARCIKKDKEHGAEEQPSDHSNRCVTVWNSSSSSLLLILISRDSPSKRRWKKSMPGGEHLHEEHVVVVLLPRLRFVLLHSLTM